MQFSLKSLALAIVTVAVMCAICFSPIEGLAAIVLQAVMMLSPAPMVACIVYDRAAARAFGIGWMTALPTLILLLYFDAFQLITYSYGSQYTEALMFSGILAALSASGLLSVLVRFAAIKNMSEA